MRSLSSLCAVAALSLASMTAAQAAEVAFAVGSTGESTLAYRLGLQCDFQRNFTESATGRFTGYWDTAYTYWQGDKTASNNSLSLAPVFVYEFAGETIKPYVEAGIGVAFSPTPSWKATTSARPSSLKTASALACASMARKSACVPCITQTPA